MKRECVSPNTFQVNREVSVIGGDLLTVLSPAAMPGREAESYHAFLMMTQAYGLVCGRVLVTKTYIEEVVLYSSPIIRLKKG